MKATKFDYEKPRSLDEAIRLLAEGDGMAKLIAGGQSLGPMLNLRLAQPGLLVDIRSLPELTVVEETPEAVVLGAATTHAAIEDGRVPDPTNGLLAKVARGIAYRAVRNRGTLGGSVAHGDPAADWVTLMALLDAEILVRGARGGREVRASQFFAGPLTTVLETDEVLTGIRIPRLSPKARWSYYKFNRKTGEFAEAIGAFLVDPERRLCRGVIGATGDVPHAIADARALAGPVDAAAIDAAVEKAGFERGTYEFQIHAVALRRASMALDA